MALFSEECGKCGSREHATRDCPHGLLSDKCNKCGSRNHATQDCPHGILSSKCSKCGSKNHATQDCPHGILSSKCGKCGSKNHATQDCPHGILSSKCGKCGSRDHATHECPHGLFATPRRETPRSIDHEDSSGEDTLVKLIVGVAVVAFLFWFAMLVAIPLIVINIASIALLGGVIKKKWSKVLFPVSIMGAIILIGDYNYGWATHVLVSNVAFFRSWIKPLLYLNLSAGLIAAYLSIRYVLNTRMPPPVGAGELSKRNLIAIGCLLAVGATTIGIQEYVNTNAGHSDSAPQSQVQSSPTHTANSGPVQIVIHPNQDGCYGTIYLIRGCGSTENLSIGGWGDYYYDFLQFDVSRLPDSAQTSRAELWLWGSAPADPHLRLERVTQAWTEDSLSAANNPSSIFVLNLPPVPSTSSWIKVDVTALYKAWKDQKYPNFGIKLGPASNNHTNGSIASVDNRNKDIRPRLVIFTKPGS